MRSELGTILVCTMISVGGCTSVMHGEPGLDAGTADGGTRPDTGSADASAAPDAPAVLDAAAAPDAGCTTCGTDCVDTSSDARHCGTCDHPCIVGPHVVSNSCASSACVLTCAAGFANCNDRDDDGCESDLSAVGTCGSCTVACAGATPLCGMTGSTHACVNGCTAPTSTLCGTTCVDTTTDPTHCGGCEQPCAALPHSIATCATSTCGFACVTGFHECSGVCVDSTSTATCGTSCSACPAAPANASATCVAGVCGSECNAGFHSCGGTCVSNSSAATCGTSCSPCSAPAHATATCSGSRCGYACNPGYHDCSGTCYTTAMPCP